MWRWWQRWCWVVLLASAGMAVPAEADQPFRRGIEAWDEERWADVAEQMRAAIRDKGEEGGVVRLYGQRYEDYLPHYYLGLALARLDDCRGAVPALEESNRQGRLKRGQQRELDRALSACRDRLAARRPPSPPPPPPAEPPPPVATPPTVPATDTEKDGSPLATEPEEGIAIGDDAPTTPEPSLPGRDPRDREEEPSSSELPADPPVPSREPPPELRRAVEAFLDSEYARASRLLGSASFTAPKARAAAHLLRAAAVYALYLEGGGEDGSLLRLARLEAERWRAEPAGIRASAGAFSPPVLAFLEGDG